MTTAILLASAANAAAAARTECPQMALATSTVSKTNFLVHYDPATITAPQANVLANDAEAGRTLETTTLGFPAALNDAAVTVTTPGGNPDGRTDVWVYPDTTCAAVGVTTTCGCNGFMAPDQSPSNTGWIYMNPAAVENHSSIPHEYFHAIQLGIQRAALAHDMLREASASWIGALASGTDGGHTPVWLRNSGIGQSLDFPDNGTELLYGAWPFFEYESERFSPAALKDTFAQATNALTPQTTWMNAALAARGASLGQAVTEYAGNVLAADWPTSGGGALLRGRFPIFESTDTLGVTTNTSASRTAALDRLTTRFFRLNSNACQGTCNATLHMDLGWPAGSGVQAALVKLGNTPADRVALTNGASGAHADLPFNLGTQYGVAITNPSLTANSVPVSLNANATTDASSGSGTSTTPKTTTPPPPPPPPTVTGPPTIQLSVNPRVSRSGRSRVLRFTLDSSAAGFVVVTLTSGKAKLVAHTAAKATTFSRTIAVKQGTFTYRVPLSRRVPKGRYTVSLTPESTTGTTGTPISGGRISVPKLPKAKKKRTARFYR